MGKKGFLSGKLEFETPEWKLYAYFIRNHEKIQMIVICQISKFHTPIFFVI